MASERIESGREILAWLDAGNEERLRALLDELAPGMTEVILGFFGDVYARPGLAMRDRMIVTLSAIAALGHAQPQLAAHVKNALNIGLSREEIVEILMQVSGYAGFPAALNALATAKGVFEQTDKR